MANTQKTASYYFFHRFICCDDKKRLKRIAQIMRALTGKNWQQSHLCSHVMTSSSTPILVCYSGEAA